MNEPHRRTFTLFGGNACRIWAYTSTEIFTHVKENVRVCVLGCVDVNINNSEGSLFCLIRNCLGVIGKHFNMSKRMAENTAMCLDAFLMAVS